jgi:HK97 family phage major capsid protein
MQCAASARKGSTVELKELMEQLKKEWETFKTEQDRNLKDQAKNGREDPITAEKINKHSAAIGVIEKQISELSAKLNRPGVVIGEMEQKEKEHLESFRGFMRKNGLQGSAKSVNVGTDPEGGWGVPATVDAAILQYETDNTPMREVCDVITVGNEEYSQLVNLGGASSGWVGETEARSETNTPTLAELKPFFGEIYANPAATQKSLDDIAFSVEGWLAQEVGREFAEQENDAFTNGTGVKKPKGILAYTLAATADATRTFGQIEKLHTASAGAFTIDKIIDLVHLMKRGYRTGAIMMTTTLAVGAIRKLKSGDVYVYQPSMLEGEPARLLGYPIVENDDMPVPTTDAKALIFGNFKRGYRICDVKGVTVLRDPYTNKPKVHFYTTKRLGGYVMNDRCFKVLVLST